MIAPIRRNTSKSRVSEISLGDWAIYRDSIRRLRISVRGRTHLHETGGIAPTGAIPTKTPSRLRGVPPLPSYSPNRLDRSGRPRAAAERHKPYIRAKSPLRSIAAAKQPLHFPLEFRKRRIERLLAGIDDD